MGINGLDLLMLLLLDAHYHSVNIPRHGADGGSVSSVACQFLHFVLRVGTMAQTGWLIVMFSVHCNVHGISSVIVLRLGLMDPIHMIPYTLCVIVYILLVFSSWAWAGVCCMRVAIWFGVDACLPHSLKWFIQSSLRFNYRNNDFPPHWSLCRFCKGVVGGVASKVVQCRLPCYKSASKMTVLALCLHWDWFCGFDLRKDEKSFEMLHLHRDVYGRV